MILSLGMCDIQISIKAYLIYIFYIKKALYTPKHGLLC